jgi:hypothetical protein
MVQKNRFGRLYDWAHSKGLKEVNQAYLMSQQGLFVPLVAALAKGSEWHDDFPKPLLQASFVHAARQSRLTKAPLSYTAAELSALSKETVAHLADVFDFPYSASSSLQSNPAATPEGLSDELGRARLRDCVRLRGSFDPVEAGKCAGYNVQQNDLANCLSGGRCLPPFGTEVNLETLLVKPEKGLADIATSNALPRIRLGKVEDLRTIVDKCQAVDSSDSGFCLLKETVGRDQKSRSNIVLRTHCRRWCGCCGEMRSGWAPR